MPDNFQQAGSSEEWLGRARSNLIRARQPKPEGVYWEDPCFDAQQAVEKALKALLLYRGMQFRFVHDIGELLVQIEQSGIEVPDAIRLASDLTVYAVESRYPGVVEPVTEDEYDQAIEIAERVIRWVSSLIAQR